MTEEQKLLLMAQRSRQNYAEVFRPLLSDGMADVKVEKALFPTCAGWTPVYLYRPQGDCQEPLPVWVNFHGGGFIQGSPEDDDHWCRQISAGAHCLIVSVDYQLAPERQFPFQLEECYDVLIWLNRQGLSLGADSKRMAVGGSSAGANFAAALCLLVRQRKELSILYQVLNYPPLDFVTDPQEKGEEDRLLTPRAQTFFTACYLPTPQERVNPLASPLLAEDLAGLPPALIIAAELDPLCAENAAYARRLNEAGTLAEFHCYPGCMHAFTHLGPVEEAQAAWALIQERLRQVFWRCE